MQGLRSSSYLNQVEVGDGLSLLYNGATLCIDAVPTPYARRLADATAGGDFSFLSREETQHLLERGHLTKLDPAEELMEFRKLVQFVIDQGAEQRRARPRAILSFILTYNCNLSCAYCYQKSLAGKARGLAMSGQFVDDLFAHSLAQIFPGVEAQNLLFLLFGGEPLLPGNRQALLKILEYAEKHSIKISTATNATTLPAMADLIGSRKGKIENVQVTLDGDRLLHDQNRIPRSGEPTFDEMIEAIRRLMRLEAHVFIRVHTHPGKLAAAERLIAFLEEAEILGHPQVEVYFAPINTFRMDADSLAGDGSPRPDSDYDIFCRLFQDVALKTKRPPSLNMEFLNDIMNMASKNLLPKSRFCSLGANDVRIVDPQGDIYGCFEEAGHQERRIGAIRDRQVEVFPLQQEYAKRHLLNLPECLNCSAALFCGGGCPNQARLQNGSIFTPYCLQNREFIAQTLKAYFLLSQSPGAATEGEVARARPTAVC